tara:strand:+ start:2271 stop:3212 length:942 start_codon:yes stop_codon:yes gene_type:complete
MMNYSGGKRQPAIRIFAREFTESSLNERGSGEFDPSFVITKLGAKVSRAMVCGVIDRMERRDGDSGTSYSGTLRDPTGSHFFNIPPFKPELHADAEELASQFESGSRFLVLVIGKARWYENEDGGVFTSFTVDEITPIGINRYRDWLIETADATLRRVKAYDDSSGADLELNSLTNAGVPPDLVEGLVKSREAYSEVDTEEYVLFARQAISMANRNNSSILESTMEGENESEEQKNDEETSLPEINNGDISELIITTISSKDDGTGVDYDTIILACVHSGFSREQAEDSLDDLRDNIGSIFEPRFGFFQVSPP